MYFLSHRIHSHRKKNYTKNTESIMYFHFLDSLVSLESSRDNPTQEPKTRQPHRSVTIQGWERPTFAPPTTKNISDNTLQPSRFNNRDYENYNYIVSKLCKFSQYLYQIPT